MSSTTDVPSLVDRLRYPLEGAGRDDLVRRARASLHHDGAVELPGFVTEPAVALLAEEARDLAARRTWRSEGVGTAYLAPPDPMVPSDHPTRHLGRFATGVVPYDLFGVDSLIRQFYEWEPLRQLVEDIVDRGPLHPYGDPFGALNLAVMENGDELQWHFDQTDFVVSLAIASATSGGRFEAAPRVRTVDDERFSEVQSVIEGRSDQVYVHPMVAGTLLIFEGRHSLHRVSPVEGHQARLVALLAYDTLEGRCGSALLHQTRYGRTTPFPEPPDDTTYRQWLEGTG